MKYYVTVKGNLTNNEYYTFKDPKADLRINGNLKCISPFKSSLAVTILKANSITINGELDCEKIYIIANSIFLNNFIKTHEAIYIRSYGLLDLGANISNNSGAVDLKAERLIIRDDINFPSFNNNISADKILLLGNIKSTNNLTLSITNYIIKVGSLPLSEFKYFSILELKDIEKIKKALVEDFNIKEPELSEILEKYKS